MIEKVDGYINLKDYPHPISINQAYAGTNRRFKSKKYNDYLKEIEQYKLELKDLDSHSNYLKKWIYESKRNILKIELIYFQAHSKCFNKKGDIKKDDLSNYLKVLLDTLSNLIDIDDRFFFVIIMYKIPTKSKNRVNIKISKTKVI